jgi:hypothetical protein
MDTNVRKWFNTEGPCDPDLDYLLPALKRLPSIESLIARSKYIVFHAPRQSGKTTAIEACVDRINKNPDSPYHALHVSLEDNAGFVEPGKGMELIADSILHALEESDVAELNDAWKGIPISAGSGPAPPAEDGPEAPQHPPLDPLKAVGNTLTYLCM